jgi:hypothetical protein
MRMMTRKKRSRALAPALVLVLVQPPHRQKRSLPDRRLVTAGMLWLARASCWRQQKREMDAHSRLLATG